MSAERTSLDLSQVALIIPALNEAECLAILLPMLKPLGLSQTIVCDNGSTDATREVVERNEALWAYESKRGYGAACWAGMQRLAVSVQVVAFMDADLSDDPNMLPALVEPILRGDCDLVMGDRAAHLRDPGSTSFPQRIANRLFPTLIRLGWGHTFADLGPFRAIRRSCLDAIDMQDRAFGWTIEMQVKAVELGMRIREIPVPYRKRPAGSSKISGSVRGACLAAYWITRTCAGLWITKRRRLKRQPLQRTS